LIDAVAGDLSAPRAHGRRQVVAVSGAEDPATRHLATHRDLCDCRVPRTVAIAVAVDGDGPIERPIAVVVEPIV
jgi:hypothetical protein